MNLSDIYRGISTVQIGTSNTALFWKDLWSDQLNDEAFPRAFSFTKLEDASVADFMAITNIHTGFHLPLTPLARQELQQLQAQTADTIPDSNKPDQWTYSWEPNIRRLDTINFSPGMFRLIQPLLGFGTLNARPRSK